MKLDPGGERTAVTALHRGRREELLQRRSGQFEISQALAVGKMAVIPSVARDPASVKKIPRFTRDDSSWFA